MTFVFVVCMFVVCVRTSFVTCYVLMLLFMFVVLFLSRFFCLLYFYVLLLIAYILCCFHPPVSWFNWDRQGMDFGIVDGSCARRLTIARGVALPRTLTSLEPLRETTRRTVGAEPADEARAVDGVGRSKL